MRLYNKEIKISKGYRLKPSTHELINKIRILIKGDYDMAIARSCKKYLKVIGSVRKNKSASKLEKFEKQTKLK